MATTSEQRKQYVSLRSKWTSIEEAKAKAYGNVAPVSPPAGKVQPAGWATLPIAPQVTSFTPTPTTAVPTTVAPSSTQPTIVEAPRDPTTGLSAPQASVPTPATTSTPTSTSPTPTTPVDPVQVEREKITAQNKATLEQNRQKVQLERENKALDAQALIPTDQKSIVQALASGVSVPEQNTPEYRNAQTIYKNFQKYNSMTDTELLNNLKQGNIGSELDSLLNQNPSYAQAKAQLSKVQKTDSLNRMGQSIVNVATNKEPVDLADLWSVERKYSPPIGANEQAYTDYVTNNEQVKSSWLALSKISRDISDASTTYNDALKELKTKYQGKLGASELLLMMWSRTKDTKDLIDSLVNAKTLAQGDFDLAMKMAEWQYGAVSKDIANQEAIAKEARDTQTAREKSVFDANLSNQSAVFQNNLSQSNAQFQTIGDKVYKVQNGQMTEMPWIKPTSNQWQSTNITRYNPLTWANESTPVFYRKKDTWAWFEAVDLSGNPIDANLLGWSMWGTGWGTSTGTYATWTDAMRTDRNMNPTAFTTDIAKQAGLVEWVDYVKWDKFPWNSNLYTAKLIWDPIETTIRAIDAIGFKTKWGADRWVYTSKLWLNNETWDKMSPTEKANAVKRMYQQEWGNGTAIWESNQNSQSKFNPLQTKEFEAYDWKTIPAQYKTPMEQDQFVKDYNEWRDSRPWVKIENGEDLLNIKLDKPNADQSASMAYGARMINAAKNIMQYEDEFSKLPLKNQVYQEYAPSIATSENQKKLVREKMDFITAVLRKESWAAISASEYDWQNKIYFPQPWDSPEVIVNKRNARNFRVKAMLATAWTDLDWNSPSKYYNPPIITSQTASWNETDIKNRIAERRKKANQ